MYQIRNKKDSFKPAGKKVSRKSLLENGLMPKKIGFFNLYFYKKNS